MKLFHYSATKITAPKSVAQKNSWADGTPLGKPRGLWVSVDDDWKRWCESEHFYLSNFTYEHEVILAPDANILYLKNAQEIRGFGVEFAYKRSKLNKISSAGFIYDIDWVKVARRWQGIIIAPYSYEMRLSDHMWYYGWDCASGCIWDAAAIKDIKVVAKNEPVKEVEVLIA